MGQCGKNREVYISACMRKENSENGKFAYRVKVRKDSVNLTQTFATRKEADDWEKNGF